MYYNRSVYDLIEIIIVYLLLVVVYYVFYIAIHATMQKYELIHSRKLMDEKLNSMEKYKQLSSFGKVHTEFVIEKKLYRILIGPFSSVIEAKNVKANSMKGGFPKAFIVKYEDGIRVGMTAL